MTEVAASNAHVEHYLQLSSEERVKSERVRPSLDALVADLSRATQLSASTRRALLQALLSSVPSLVAEHEPSTLSLLATGLKLLGRSPDGSEVLASREGLSALLQLAEIGNDSPSPSRQGSDVSAAEGRLGTSSLPENELAPHVAEALRSLANTLTLHPDAREVVPTLLLDGAVLRLEPLLAQKGWASFLAARILFLATAGTSSSELVAHLTDSQCITGMRQYATLYLTSLERDPTSLMGPMPNDNDVLREHLKLAYNLMLQYGRHVDPTVGEAAVLLTDRTNSGGDASASLTLESCKPFLPLFQPYYRLSCLLPLYSEGGAPGIPSPLTLSALNTLLNYPIELEELDYGREYSWCQPLSNALDERAEPEDPTKANNALPLVERLLEIVEKSCETWFPYRAPRSIEPAKSLPSVDDLLTGPDTTETAARAEEILGPVLLLLRKLALLSAPAEHLNSKIFPVDLDRSVPLSYHQGLTGHLVRLASSILLPNSSYGAIEVIYNLCGREPEQLARAVGYGLASGWLQSRGELIPPPAPPSPHSNSAAGSGAMKGVDVEPIDPITGARARPVHAAHDSKFVEMTDEEKEREAERLFVMFERMQKTGVMSAENPVAKAQREGRLEELDDGDQGAEEDEAIEAEVARDMKAYRARK